MKSTKVVALLITVSTISGLSANLCHDRYGNERSCTGRAVEGTFDVAGDAVDTLNPFNWGRGGESRREARRDAREARDDAAAARRDAAAARREAERARNSR